MQAALWGLLPLASAQHCVFDGAGGARFDLSSWAGRTITAPDANGGSYNVSLCGDLPNRCVDSLTGTTMPPGSVFSMFEGEPSGTCWDVLSHWGDLHSTGPPPPQSGAAVRLIFSHAFDAHLGCETSNVTVVVDAACNKSLPVSQDPLAIGIKTAGECQWQIRIQTASPAICSPVPSSRRREAIT